MAKTKRTKIERENDLAQVAEMYLSGYKQADIAAKLGVAQQQISYDLKVLQKRWQASATRDINEAKSRELDRIDNLERTYWEAYRKSQKSLTTTTVDREKIVVDAENKMHRGAQGLAVPGDDGEVIRTSTRTEKRIGDAKYLQGVQWCIEQRCRILGINAPVKVAPTNPTGEESYQNDGGLTDTAAIDRIATLFNEVRARRTQDSTSEA